MDDYTDAAKDNLGIKAADDNDQDVVAATDQDGDGPQKHWNQYQKECQGTQNSIIIIDNA